MGQLQIITQKSKKKSDQINRDRFNIPKFEAIDTARSVSEGRVVGTFEFFIIKNLCLEDMLSTFIEDIAAYPALQRQAIEK